MPKSAGNKGKNAAAKKSNPSAGRFFRRIFLSAVYLLAFYGLHSLVSDCSESYRIAADNCLSATGQCITKGAKNVENSLAPQPSVVIKNAEEAANSPHDNLKLGVPTYKCDIIIDRVGYALGYSEKYEQPLWVTYKLTAEEVNSKKARRSGDFRSDPYIATGSAAPEDYKKSFFDRGHLAPAADMSFSLQAMSESFYMSNMSPQRPEFNRGIWKKLESKVRDYAQANGMIYVVSGPIFDRNMPSITIGSNKVSVPDKYYKVILDPNTISPKAIGFIIDNRQSSRPLSDFAVTVDAVEAATGLDFFSALDDSDEQRLESNANYGQWESLLPVKKSRSRRSKK